MMTMTKTPKRTGTGRTRVTDILLAGALLAAAPLAPVVGFELPAQERRGEAPLPPCTEGRMLGSLGITGLRCHNCSFSSTRGVVVQARFDTEPEIIGVDDDSPLRVGDVLIAVDGDLITTREGVRRFTSVGPNETVRLTVRRGGTEREVRVRAIPSCLRTAMPEPPRPPSAAGVPEPAAAPSARAPVEPLPPAEVAPAPGELPPLPPPAPTPPVVSEIRPDARLGFGFECDDCTYSGSSGRWSFEAHPIVYRVEPGGPADGLLRSGDRLEAVNGADLTSDAGGRAFSDLRPGDDVRWTVRRDGSRREVVTRAEAKQRDLIPADLATPRAAAPPLPRAEGARASAEEERARAAALAADRLGAVRGTLRYAGGVGPAQVEVRGEPVTVTREGNVLVVRTRGNEIRIVVGDRDGGLIPPAP